MKKKEPITIFNLLVSVACLVIGILLFLNDGVLDIVGYIISIILFLYGVVRMLSLTHRKKKGLEVENSGYLAAIIAIIFAILIAIFPKSISISISIVLGTLAIIFGVNRLILGFAIRVVDNRGSKLFIIESLLTIALGIIIITQKFLNLLGLFLIFYSISELISYIYYKINDDNYETVFNKKISKEIKNSKSIEAIVDEN